MKYVKFWPQEYSVLLEVEAGPATLQLDLDEAYEALSDLKQALDIMENRK